MISFKEATWVKSGNQITLSYGAKSVRTVQVSGSTITDKETFENNNVTYTITYIYTAKPK